MHSQQILKGQQIKKQYQNPQIHILYKFYFPALAFPPYFFLLINFIDHIMIQLYTYPGM